MDLMWRYTKHSFEPEIQLFLTVEVEIKEHSMGQTLREALRVGFDRTVRLKFHGSRVPSDAGLIAYGKISCEDQITAMVSRKAVTDD